MEPFNFQKGFKKEHVLKRFEAFERVCRIYISYSLLSLDSVVKYPFLFKSW